MHNSELAAASERRTFLVQNASLVAKNPFNLKCTFSQVVKCICNCFWLLSQSHLVAMDDMGYWRWTLEVHFHSFRPFRRETKCRSAMRCSSMDPGMHVITHTTRLSAFMTKYLTFVRQQREREGNNKFTGAFYRVHRSPPPTTGLLMLLCTHMRHLIVAFDRLSLLAVGTHS